jgi:hypothetical protein
VLPTLTARVLLLAPRLRLVAAAIPALSALPGVRAMLARLLAPATLALPRLLLTPTALALLLALLLARLLALLLTGLLAPATLTLLTGLLAPATLTALPGLLPGRTGPPRSLWRRRHVHSFETVAGPDRAAAICG